MRTDPRSRHDHDPGPGGQARGPGSARALTRLPREQREALLLVGAEGLSYEEAAEALATKVGTIKSRVNRAQDPPGRADGHSPRRGITRSSGAST